MTPWKIIDDLDCGWWIDNGVEPLSVSLKQALNSTDAELAEKGQNGRKAVVEKYAWPVVVEDLVDIYYEVVEIGT